MAQFPVLIKLMAVLYMPMPPFWTSFHVIKMLFLRVTIRQQVAKRPNTPSALQLNSSTLNLNAGEHNIIFNDRIIGTGTLNINQTGTWDKEAKPSTPDGNKIPTWAPTTGTIELNENMSAFEGDVNIYGGTVKLGEDRTNTYSQVVKPEFFFADNLNLYGGTIDLQNKKIDSVTIRNFNGSVDSDGNALGNLKIDANLSAGTADNFYLYEYATGKLNISGITSSQTAPHRRLPYFTVKTRPNSAFSRHTQTK